MTMFEVLAKSLDTLPEVGRIALLAVLLSLLLVGLARVLRAHESVALQILYRQAAAFALLAVPVLVWLIGLQFPVYVEEPQPYAVASPRWVSLAVLGIWLLGALIALSRLGLTWRRQHQSLSSNVAQTPDTHLHARLAHWQQRLGLKQSPRLVVGGGQQAWHAGPVLTLPAATANWKAGVTDTVILLQLAQLKQNVWRWLLVVRIVEVLYWPFPWLKWLFGPLTGMMVERSMALAQSAYRDADGWRRDLKQVRNRYETLDPVAPGLLCVGSVLPDVPAHVSAQVQLDDGTWEATVARRDARYFDPYERVYWLVAVVAVLASVSTSLTLEKASPEFEPQYLKLRWQDQMQRRIADQPERTRRSEPPRQIDGPEDSAG